MEKKVLQKESNNKVQKLVFSVTKLFEDFYIPQEKENK